jgi:predicted DsbA family dithiol-disulfide isomerase
MDGPEVLRLLAMPTDAKEVMEEVQKAYELGVQGVPTFIIDHRYGISGAQEAETLADAIRQVAAKA